MLQKTYELIKIREIQGISVTLYGKILILAGTIVSMLFTTHNMQEIVIVLSVFLPCLLILIYFAFHLKEKKDVNFIGYSSLFIDLIIVWLLPFLWYDSNGGDAIARTYLLKTSIPMVIYTLLVINSLALNPYYPLFFSIGSSALYVVLYIYAIQDPRVLISDDFLLPYMDAYVNPTMYFMNVLLTLTAGFVLFLISSRARKTIIESSSFEVKTSQLSRYFSPNVVKTITQSELPFFQPGGKVQQTVVLFSDIRNFTHLCETHPPEEIISMLADYHQFMVSVIFEHNGTLDKFIGDGIMATFGTPNQSDHDVRDAVTSALAMREKLYHFNAVRNEKGLFKIQHGIGIHTGPAIVGNVGTESRLEYTVIGDTVNIASRIGSHCKVADEDILISKDVQELIENYFPTKSFGKIQLKGRKKEIELFGVWR